MKELIVGTPAFEHGGLIPIENTGYGSDISPELNLENIDQQTISIAIIMDDLDHPIKRGYNHWVIWNIPVVHTIPANIPHGGTVESLSGAIQGNAFGKHRYRGPKPPFSWSHRYQFNVYTLDRLLDIPTASKKRDLLKAMEGHVLQHAVLIGHYR